jgi:Glycosyl hydrolase family 14
MSQRVWLIPFRSMVCFFLFVSSCLCASAKEIASWQASAPQEARGLSLVREKDASWNIEKQSGVSVAAIVPVNDYYRRAAFVVRVDKHPTGPAWLSVEYLDRGFGLISISSGMPQAFRRPMAQPSDEEGIARLNTGKIRHATFRLDASAFDHPLRIYGVTDLCALRLSDSPPAHEPVPDVPPAVKLQRPMSLVMGSLEGDVRTGHLSETLANLRNQLPLVRALGFNGAESYVRWNAVEQAQGQYDWSYYDAEVAEDQKHGLLWEPFVIIGSAYTLPDWFHDGPDHLGYECLEHSERTEIQTIFSDSWPKYVQSFLAEFGRHYVPGKRLIELDLGISGDYGEVLYPASAGANMLYRGRPFHTHNGYWAGGSEAVESFRTWLRSRYASISELNKAWQTEFKSFDEVQTFLPSTARTPRQRLDFCDWYLDSMSEWASRWDDWAKSAVPNAPIYLKVGGNGETYLGADFTRVTRDAARRGVDIRVTNEGDSFARNFAMTRLLSSATRFYGNRFSLEPAGRSTARGVVGRLFGGLVDNADELFFYTPNFFSNDQAIAKWIRYAPLLDRRAKPVIDIAAFYPDTANKLDEIGTNVNGPFFNRVYALRSITDYDFASEQMILDGALDRYKVLIFLWGDTIEKPVLDRIAQWVDNGGTVIMGLTRLHTVEGDTSVVRRWAQGETGKGRVILYRGDDLPIDSYMRFLRSELQGLNNLHPAVKQALQMEKPDTLYWSILENGQLAILNYGDAPATVSFAGRTLHIEPYGILLEKL